MIAKLFRVDLGTEFLITQQVTILLPLYTCNIQYMCTMVIKLFRWGGGGLPLASSFEVVHVGQQHVTMAPAQIIVWMA